MISFAGFKNITPRTAEFDPLRPLGPVPVQRPLTRSSGHPCLGACGQIARPFPLVVRGGLRLAFARCWGRASTDAIEPSPTLLRSSITRPPMKACDSAASYLICNLTSGLTTRCRNDRGREPVEYLALSLDIWVSTSVADCRPHKLTQHSCENTSRGVSAQNNPDNHSPRSAYLGHARLLESVEAELARTSIANP
jgi:hypothetical protein